MDDLEDGELPGDHHGSDSEVEAMGNTLYSAAAQVAGSESSDDMTMPSNKRQIAALLKDFDKAYSEATKDGSGILDDKSRKHVYRTAKDSLGKYCVYPEAADTSTYIIAMKSLAEYAKVFILRLFTPHGTSSSSTQKQKDQRNFFRPLLAQILQHIEELCALLSEHPDSRRALYMHRGFMDNMWWTAAALNIDQAVFLEFLEVIKEYFTPRRENSYQVERAARSFKKLEFSADPTDNAAVLLSINASGFRLANSVDGNTHSFEHDMLLALYSVRELLRTAKKSDEVLKNPSTMTAVLEALEVVKSRIAKQKVVDKRRSAESHPSSEGKAMATDGEEGDSDGAMDEGEEDDEDDEDKDFQQGLLNSLENQGGANGSPGVLDDGEEEGDSDGAMDEGEEDNEDDEDKDFQQGLLNSLEDQGGANGSPGVLDDGEEEGGSNLPEPEAMDEREEDDEDDEDQDFQQGLLNSLENQGGASGSLGMMDDGEEEEDPSAMDIDDEDQ